MTTELTASTDRLVQWRKAVGGLAGWRRWGILALAGALSALALPPVGALPVLIVTFPILVWNWQSSASLRSAFAACWWWCLGFYSAGFYWIAHAMLIEPEKFGWMVPFATLGLGGLIAIFAAVPISVAWAIRARGPGRILVLAVAWTLGEWFRTFVLTGFPWNPLGSVWDPVLPVLQVGSLLGVHGLSLMTALVFGSLALLPDYQSRRWRVAIVGAALALPLAALVWGSVRLATNPTQMVQGVSLRLVQPAVSQANKWRDDQRERTLALMIDLSLRPGFESATDVIWPETAAPYFLDLDDVHRAEAVRAAPERGLLITGAPRVTPRGTEPFQIWNSVMVMDALGRIRGVYDKVHLVPFGEYVPMRNLLPIAKITHGGADFSSGVGHQTLDLPGLPPVAPLVCYEAIFPGEVVDKDEKRPQWLLNVTNDGWFGQSAGPYQHLAAARMRAIEEGLPMARAANTGISAVIDPLGRDIARLELGRQGVLDAPLPKPVEGITPYGRWGDLPVFVLAALVAMAGIALRKGR